MTMQLYDFVETGKDCEDLGKALSDARWEGESSPARGRVYLDCLYIERKPVDGWPNGAPEEWHLTTDGRTEYMSDDLHDLEKLLWQWAGQNGYLD